MVLPLLPLFTAEFRGVGQLHSRPAYAPRPHARGHAWFAGWISAALCAQFLLLCRVAGACDAACTCPHSGLSNALQPGCMHLGLLSSWPARPPQCQSTMALFHIEDGPDGRRRGLCLACQTVASGYDRPGDVQYRDLVRACYFKSSQALQALLNVHHAAP